MNCEGRQNKRFISKRIKIQKHLINNTLGRIIPLPDFVAGQKNTFIWLVSAGMYYL